MDFNTGDKKSKIIVPLKLICDAIEMADDMWNQYLDIEEMEVVSVPAESYMGMLDEEDQELADRIEEGWRTRFFSLPSKFDIHEYSIMEDFVWQLPQGRVQDSLADAIRGKGAFRRFKDGIYRFGIEEQWYEFEEARYQKMAVEWCENHGFGYFEDSVQKEKGAAGAGADLSAGDSLEWQEIRTEHVVQDEWIDFRRSAYRFPDGKVFEPFYSYSRKDYVVIVAADEDGKYLCVRQFRQGIKEVTTEFPAGGIERTDGREYGGGCRPGESEDALKAAKRELLEETGYVSDDWRYLITVPSNATMADNYAHIFAAENCRKLGGQSLDETEFLNVEKYSADEIEEKIRNGEFQQAIHIMAWLLVMRGGNMTQTKEATP